MIADGYQLLAELGAVDEANAADARSGGGSRAFPSIPRVARMILAGEHENCLAEILIIAAVLEVDDPRERPFEQRRGGRPGPRAVPRRAVGLSRAAQAVGPFRGRARAPQVESQARAGAARTVSVAAPAARVARRAPPARRAGGRDGHARQREARDLRADAPRADRRAARQHRLQGRGGGRIPGRARHQVLRSFPARGCARSSRTG